MSDENKLKWTAKPTQAQMELATKISVSLRTNSFGKVADCVVLIANTQFIGRLSPVSVRNEIARILCESDEANQNPPGASQDAKQPGPADWRNYPIGLLFGPNSRRVDVLIASGILIVGDLQDLFDREGKLWFVDIPGIGVAEAIRIEEALQVFIRNSLRK